MLQQHPAAPRKGWLAKMPLHVVAAFILASAILFTPLINSAKAQEIAPENSLVSLRYIYVEDASAPWFLRWYKNLLDRVPYVSPEIIIVPAEDIAEMVSSRPSAIGLVDMARLSTGNRSPDTVRVVSSGFGVCAALIAGTNSGITEIGDLHLMLGKVEVAATGDTINIAKTIFETHRAAIKVNLVETPPLDILNGLATGQIPLAILPTEDGARLKLLPPNAEIRVIGLSPAALAAGQ